MGLIHLLDLAQHLIDFERALDGFPTRRPSLSQSGSSTDNSVHAIPSASPAPQNPVNPAPPLGGSRDLGGDTGFPPPSCRRPGEPLVKGGQQEDVGAAKGPHVGCASPRASPVGQPFARKASSTPNAGPIPAQARPLRTFRANRPGPHDRWATFVSYSSRGPSTVGRPEPIFRARGPPVPSRGGTRSGRSAMDDLVLGSARSRSRGRNACSLPRPR
jgi:hypothetical protein